MHCSASLLGILDEQVPESRRQREMFGKQPSWIANNCGTFWHITGDHRSHAHSCVVADRHVVANTGCRPDPHPRTDACRSADDRQRNDDRVRPHVHVMADVHEVVDLDATVDSRHTERPAIDAGIGTDFDVVTDLDGPEVWKALEPAIRGAFKPEAVGSQDCTRVDPHLAADSNAAVKVDAGFESATLAYFAGLSNRAQGPNRDIVGEAGAGGHRSGRVDVRFRPCLEEACGSAGEGQPGVVDSQDGGDTGVREIGIANGGGPIDEQQRRSGSGVELGPTGGRGREKGDGAGTGLCDRRYSIEDELLGRDATGKMQGCFRAERGSNVGDGDRLHTLVRCHPDRTG